MSDRVDRLDTLENSTKTVLVVDDEPGIRQLVALFLRRYHFRILEAENGKALFQILQKEPVDLILLDLMLPDIYGVEICKEIRKTSQVPIIMLTAAHGEMNMVLGFEAGADDYIEKPFSVHVLLSRIQAILRRTKPSQTPRTKDDTNTSSLNQTDEIKIDVNAIKTPTEFKKAQIGPWSYNVEMAELQHASGRRVLLTRNESLLLNLFLKNHNQPLPREQLMSELNFPTEDLESRAIDVQVSRLRHKLRDRTDSNLIQTVRNTGYALVSPVSFER